MKTFSWQTPEYAYKEKTSDWYWTVGIIAAALVVVSIIFGNALFGGVIAIAAFSLALFSSRKPPVVSVEVSDKGVKVGKILYPYPSLDSFGIDEERLGGPKLFLKSKKVVMPLVAVPIAHPDIAELREFLSERLSEETFEQTLMQAIFERLGF
ncbi:MAG: hypothetical protein HZA81_04140 [Candidatus Taylorbacteria bacterium]|nr:hypothetical protein [Candidatus Taylorbacteria bacterium]